MIAEDRIYRTADGELVDEGDSGAAFLAYAPGDEVAEKDAAELKKRSAPANKQRKPAANKAADGDGEAS